MKEEKFSQDTTTVLKFIQLYCDKNHSDCEKTNGIVQLEYKNKPLHVALDYLLCPTCTQTFLYSYARLQECPHEEKPSCRKCPTPCYEKSKWKALTKIMKFSGMQLGLLKIRKLFKFGN